MTKSLNQVTKAQLHTNLINRSTLIDTQIEDTISLAYYGLIQGDISSLLDCNQQIVSSLSAIYRKYIPAKFVNGKWEFNKTKAKSLRDKLNIQLQATFEEFLTQMNTLEAANELVKEMKQERETDAMKAQKADAKVTKYFQKQLDDGMTIEHLESLLATMKSKKVIQADNQAEFDERLKAKLAA